ncbi:MAG TPA: arginine--tRNA ligase [Clostridiales bacterium]|nr:arginine--tRNA ligase [Clostridiales bacterium]
MDYKQLISQLVYDNLEALDLTQEQIKYYLSTPPQPDLGDFALPCFKLSKVLKNSPINIADSLARKINQKPLPAELDKINAVNGYLNFYLNRPKFIKDVVDGYKNGAPKTDLGQGRVICIDYSSINIAKHFHMGHLSTTAIGGSLYRIFNYLGYKSIGINHLGDFGTQFGKLICAYKMWSSPQKLEKNGLNELHELYTRYHKKANTNPELDDIAREWSKKIEQNDPEAVQIYQKFKEITLENIGKIYQRLGISFDSYLGESFFADKVGPVVQKLEQKNLIQISDGAKVVNLDKYDMPPCLILRSDGASLYATRDLAAAIYRKDTYDFYKCLYVVAYQQNLHFRQLFKVLELMGYEWAKDLVHVSYGMVSLEDGAMSTRGGKMVKLIDVLDKAVEKIKNIIKEKNPNAKDIDQIAEAVGVGAVIFSSLCNSKIKDIVFTWDRALNFEGESGPYLQYTHARCCSVLKKSGADYNNFLLPQSLQDVKADFDIDDNTWTLIKHIDAFFDKIVLAAQDYEPSIIANAIMDIAKGYNKFYFDYKILDDDPKIQKARLLITLAVKNCLKTGMELLLLKPIEQM